MLKIILILAVVVGLIALGALLLKITPKLIADETYSSLGTSDAADGSADAINFSQGRVWTIDQYGKYIFLTQLRGNKTHWAWSNNLGSSWTQGNEEYQFLARGSVAYDSLHDKLHVIWTGLDSNDGIIYRRYGITRDGLNNITAITREDGSNINLVLDSSSSRTLEEPIALWVNDGSNNGSLVAIWAKNGANLVEVRASRLPLTLTATDGSASSWKALDGTADTFSGLDNPAVDADQIFASTTSGAVIASAKIRGGSGSRKNDLYVFTAENIDASSRVLAYRGIWNSGSLNWSGGWQPPVLVGQVNNPGGGYTHKFQLITRPVIDTTNDRLYVGWPRWKDNTNGDTVSFAYLDSSDAVSTTFDVYSALGTHSYAPALDIAFDQTIGQLYISYIESTTNGTNGSIDYKIFDGSTLGSQIRFYTNITGSNGADGSADIPILYENRSTNDRLLMAFRVNGAIPPTALDPNKIFWGYLAMANPTPTPAPTNNSSNDSNTSSSPTSSSSTCSTPEFPTPNLFQIDPAGTFVKLYFTTSGDLANRYQISYGTTPEANQYGDSFAYNGKLWILDRTINSLNPNTVYYFKIKANNDCGGTDWGNTIKVKTKGRLSDITAKIVSVIPFVKKPIPPIATRLNASSCKYTVSPGDSLWLISKLKFGTGNQYQKIINLNPELFSNIKSPTIIRIGWTLQLC